MAKPSPYELLVEAEPSRSATGKYPSSSAVYRVHYAPDGVLPIAGVSTCYDIFTFAVRKFPGRPCLGHRPIVDGQAGPYEYDTYEQVGQQADKAGSAFAALGLKAQDKVGILGANCPEWMLAMQACNRMNQVCVPLYDTLGESAIEFIIDQAEVKLVVSLGAKLGLLAKAVSNLATKPVAVVVFGEHAPQAALAVTSLDIKLLTFSDLLDLGAHNPLPPRPPTADDVSTIMYTSGTTGNPKGVIHSHRAVVSAISGVQGYLDYVGEHVDEHDVFLSYLPLAHIFDRVAEECMLLCGARIGYFQGDPRKLTDDLLACRPTIYAGVPRVFDRVYKGILDKVKKAGWLSRFLWSFFYNRKLNFIRSGVNSLKASPVGDWLVFSKIKAALGGRVRIIVSGAAPMSREIEEFLNVVMCVPVVQGYGLTETCAASFIALPSPDMIGAVGPPVGGVDVRLESIPEMKYDALAVPARGEVCVKGPGVFEGYHRQPELVKEVVDEDGFFHTGDVAELLPSGGLKIIDRKKNIFKLAQGEYIAVEHLENVYSTCPIVEQIWVYGNSYESVLVAVVVPREGVLKKWAEAEGNLPADIKELVRHPAAKKYVLDQLTATGKGARLKGFEAIKMVHLDTEPFGVENDLMTPSFKLKRAPLLKHYQKQVDAMYAELKAAEK